jgi:antitoxin component YwqK of YwqJK toxin-antitoxin module
VDSINAPVVNTWTYANGQVKARETYTLKDGFFDAYVELYQVSGEKYAEFWNDGINNYEYGFEYDKSGRKKRKCELFRNPLMYNHPILVHTLFNQDGGVICRDTSDLSIWTLRYSHVNTKGELVRYETTSFYRRKIDCYFRSDLYSTSLDESTKRTAPSPYPKRVISSFLTDYLFPDYSSEQSKICAFDNDGSDFPLFSSTHLNQNDISGLQTRSVYDLDNRLIRKTYGATYPSRMSYDVYNYYKDSLLDYQKVKIFKPVQKGYKESYDVVDSFFVATTCYPLWHIDLPFSEKPYLFKRRKDIAEFGYIPISYIKYDYRVLPKLDTKVDLDSVLTSFMALPGYPDGKWVWLFNNPYRNFHCNEKGVDFYFHFQQYFDPYCVQDVAMCMVEYKKGMPEGVFEIYYPFERNESNGEPDGYGLYPLTEVFPNLSSLSNRIVDYSGHASVNPGQPIQFYSVMKRGNFRNGTLHGKMEVFEPLHGNLIATGNYNNGLLETSESYFRNLKGDSLLAYERFVLLDEEETVTKKIMQVIEPESGMSGEIHLHIRDKCSSRQLNEFYYNSERIKDYDEWSIGKEIRYTASEYIPWLISKQIVEYILWNKTDEFFSKVLLAEGEVSLDLDIRYNFVYARLKDRSNKSIFEKQYSLQECLGIQ